MTYLLDTNVVSAIAPSRTMRPTTIARWIEANTDRLYLSVITVAEVRDGIAKAAREGASRKAAALAGWWDEMEDLYAARILPLDIAAARLAGDFNDRARAAGLSPGLGDVVIAAIAAAHQLTIVTRNARHFAPLYDRILNPFDLPGAPER